MALINVKANTEEAQKKIKELARSLEELEKLVGKPLKVGVDGKAASKTAGKGGNAGAAGAAGAGGGAGSKGTAGALVGAVMGGAGGAVLGWAGAKIYEGLKQHTQVIYQMLTGMNDVTARLESLSSMSNARFNPGQVALERLDMIDALDDERRGHNSKSLEEELTYQKVFAGKVGAEAGSMLDRIQSYFDKLRNTEGSLEDLKKLQEELQLLGFTYEELFNSSSWELAIKLLKNYRDSGKDGLNELERPMQTIVGTRQMGIVRKAVDAIPEIERAYKEELPEAAHNLRNARRALQVSDETEKTRRMVEYSKYNTDERILQHATNQSNELLAREKGIITGLVGTDREFIFQYIENALKAYLPEETAKTITNRLQSGIDTANDFVQSDGMQKTGKIYADWLLKLIPPTLISDAIMEKFTGQSTGENAFDIVEKLLKDYSTPKQFFPIHEKEIIPAQSIKNELPNLNVKIVELIGAMNNSNNSTRELNNTMTNLKISSQNGNTNTIVNNNQSATFA